MAAQRIDRQKLSDAIGGLSREHACALLDETIDFVLPAKVSKLVGRYVELTRLRPDPPGVAALLAEVKAFGESSLAGDYYEGFNVNSKNFMEKSDGTRRWIATCRRLVDRCITAAARGDPAAIDGAFETIFGLLRRINEGDYDWIFFADEAGAFQVGVEWRRVLPAWFACLAKTAAPEEYARKVVDVVEEFCDYDSRRHMVAARKVARPDQRRALRVASRRQPRNEEHAMTTRRRRRRVS